MDFSQVAVAVGQRECRIQIWTRLPDILLAALAHGGVLAIALDSPYENNGGLIDLKEDS